MFAPWKKSRDKPRQHKQKHRHYFADKGPYNQSYGFSSGHAWMWKLYHEEDWVLKNWCLWPVVLEKTLKSPLDSKEMKPILKEINPEYSLQGLMLKLQYFGHLSWKAYSWHHRLNGHEFEQTWGDSEGQGNLACCSSWGRRVGHNLATEQQQQILK